MSKKSDRFYFNNFLECADCALNAAQILEKSLTDFNSDNLKKCLDEIHQVEHDGDEKKHEMMEVLVKAFITPIEREDIIAISQNIDDVTDAIEDVLLRLYMNNVDTIHEGAVEFSKIVISCCEALKKIMFELADFKKSKDLKNLIVEVNRLEEEGDELFIKSMRELHTKCTDPVEIISWREIYIYLERCCDECEHVADVVESIIMKNS